MFVKSLFVSIYNCNQIVYNKYNYKQVIYEKLWLKSNCQYYFIYYKFV